MNDRKMVNSSFCKGQNCWRKTFRCTYVCISFSNFVVKFEMSQCSQFDRFRLLWFDNRMTEYWMKSFLIGRIFDWTNLLSGIDVGECTAYNTATIGHFAVCSIYMPMITARCIAKYIRMRWWLWCCCRIDIQWFIVCDNMRYVSRR